MITTHQWRAGVAILLTLGIIFACTVAYILITLTTERPLPFRYEDATKPDTYQRTLCPGDDLVFVLRIVVEDAPTIAMVVDNWQGPQGARPDSTPLYFIQEEAKTAISRQVVTLPTDLYPGGWVYERAATTNTIDHPALIQIPFEVLDCEEPNAP